MNKDKDSLKLKSQTIEDGTLSLEGKFKKLDVFIPGENIDLCVPTSEFAQKSDWYSWINNSKINRYLDYGLFPNTPVAQVEFFEHQKNKRVALIISNKKEYMGIVSLSGVDLTSKMASVALLINPKIDFYNSTIIALEAMARITEHGFKTMGLNRIQAGQHIKLAGWQQRMELLGYRIEGIKRGAFVKGREVADVLWIAAAYDDYLKIVDQRGKYWDSTQKMDERIKNLPEDKFSMRLDKFLKQDGDKYYEGIFNK